MLQQQRLTDSTPLRDKDISFRMKTLHWTDRKNVVFRQRSRPKYNRLKTLHEFMPGVGYPRDTKKGLSMTPALPPFLDPRRRSLVRASLLVLVSFFAAAWLSDFPHNRATPLLLLPALAAFTGTADTIRCMRKRWSFYHGGVLLLIYMDLMADMMILFFLLYPYALWLTSSR